MKSQFFKLVCQACANLRIDKGDDPSTRLDQRDMDPQRRKDGGIFRADHPPADDHHRFGDLLHIQDGIGVKDQLAIKRDLRRMMGRGTGGNENKVSRDLRLSFPGPDTNSMRIPERSLPVEQSDILMPNGLLDHAALFVHHGSLAVHEILDRQVILERVIDPIQPALPQAGEIQS